MTATRALDNSGLTGAEWAPLADASVNAAFSYNLGLLQSVAGTNTITADLTYPTGFTTPGDGARADLIPANNNTNAVTLNIEGQGAISIRDQDGAVLTADALVAGRLQAIVYNATAGYWMFAATATPVTALTESYDGAPCALVHYVQTSGTNGGGTTAGSWQTYPFNELTFDPGGLIALSANKFTPSVDMYVNAIAYLSNGGEERLRIYNVTDGVETALGLSYRNSSGGQSVVEVNAFLAAGKQYRMDYRVSTATATIGLGDAGGYGQEIYGIAKFFKKI